MSLPRFSVLALLAASAAAADPIDGGSTMPTLGETDVAASVVAVVPARPRAPWQVSSVLPGAGLDETGVAPSVLASAAAPSRAPWTVALVLPGSGLDETAVAPPLEAVAAVVPRLPWSLAVALPGAKEAADPADGSTQASAADLMTEMAAADPALKVTRDAEGEIDGLVMLSDVMFDYAVSDLKPDALRTLAAVAAKLSEVPGLEVVGHTDDVGSVAFNAALGQARAEAVRDWLVGEGHLDEARVMAVSAGELEPLAPNDTAESRALNRRVAFRIVDPAAGVE